jgi:tetratricopeptide (TPR) repeat protein
MSEEAQEIYRRLDDHVGMVVATQDLGSVAAHAGRYTKARALWSKCLELIEERRLAAGLRTRSLIGLAGVATEEGNFTAAWAFFDAARNVIDSSFEPDAVGQAVQAHLCSDSGLLALYEGDLERAQLLLQQALVLQLALRVPREQALTVALLGRVALERGDQPAAYRYFVESLAPQSGAVKGWAVALSIEGLAALVAEHDPKLALCAAGVAEAVRTSLARPASNMERALLSKWLQPAWSALDKESAQAAWGEGSTLAPDVVIARLHSSYAASVSSWVPPRGAC